MTDKLQLMLEADRRGILPPEQKALLDEAVKRGLVEKPAAVAAGDTLREIPRQVGLTARYGMEGLGDVAGIVTDPIRTMINPGLRAVGLPPAQSTRSLMTGIADKIGLPSPQGANERVIADATRLMAGGGGLAGTARKVATALPEVGSRVAASLGENVGTQTAAAAAAGGAGGSVREAGGGPVEQFGASLVGGLSGAGMSALGVKTYNGIAGVIGNLLTPKSTMQQINVTLNQILEQNGVNTSQLPGMVRSELAHEVKKALDTGRQLNPDVVRRIADYGVVGATPTRGSVTLDPVQITQERNLAKIGANSTDPRLQELAQVQNSNNARFISKLNELGAGGPNADPVVAGRAAMDTIRASDTSAKATERALYARARDSSGRALDLDREGFVASVYNKLADSNKGAFLPENIKTIIEQIRSGKVTMGGKEYPTPFTVDTIDNLKTMISTAQRSASDGNVRAALSQVRSALDEVQPVAIGRSVGGSQVVDPAGLAAAQTRANATSAESMAAFDEARRYAKARRDWQESAPGIAAALADDAQPDRFVRDYILANTGKSATAHIEKLIFEMHGNPAAQAAIKQNVVSYFKNKALSGAADEVGNFSQSAYNRALNEFGDMKLKVLFSPEEISQLKALGRVSSYEMVQPKGSAVNNSNTTSAAVGVLDRIANSALLAKIPFGDAAIRTPAKNWAAQIGVTSAMDPYASMVAQPVKQPGSVADLLGLGLLLSAPKADGRDDKQRR